jgi:hypothetical protein
MFFMANSLATNCAVDIDYWSTAAGARYAADLVLQLLARGARCFAFCIHR